MHWDRTLEERPARKQVILDDTKPARVVPSSQRFTLPEEAPIMRNVMGFLGDQARTLMRAGVATTASASTPARASTRSLTRTS